MIYIWFIYDVIYLVLCYNTKKQQGQCENKFTLEERKL